jgi:hypothetical protein
VTAAAYDIQLEQGETWTPVWTLNWPGNGTAFNLTGYTAHMQIRSSYSAGTTLLDLHSNTGGIVLGGVAGTLQPMITAALSAGLLSGPVPVSRILNGRGVYQLGVYDVKITDPSGDVSVIIGGTVWITPQVTVGGA